MLGFHPLSQPLKQYGVWFAVCSVLQSAAFDHFATYPNLRETNCRDLNPFLFCFRYKIVKPLYLAVSFPKFQRTFEQVNRIELSSSAWKADALAIVLYLRKTGYTPGDVFSRSRFRITQAPMLHRPRKQKTEA